MIQIGIFNVYGEKKDSTVYSLWGTNQTGMPYSDDLIYKTSSWASMTDYLENNSLTKEYKHVFILQNLTEEEIENYLHPSKEKLEELDFEYRCYAD